MLEIWLDLVNRLEANIELAPVQKVVLREWRYRAQARLSELQLRSQRAMLRDEEYAEMTALVAHLEKYNFVKED